MASTSSGFIIRGRRILTNAHSVEHHTQVKLKKRGSDKKYVARVLAIGVECDLALLTVDDASFFDGVTAIELGALPGRGLHSSTILLNVSTFCGIRWAHDFPPVY